MKKLFAFFTLCVVFISCSRNNNPNDSFLQTNTVTITQINFVTSMLSTTNFVTNITELVSTNFYTNYLYVYKINTTDVFITNTIDSVNIVYSLSDDLSLRFGNISGGTINYESTRTRYRAGTVTRVVEISNKSSSPITIYYIDVVDLKSDNSLWGVYRFTSTNTNNNLAPNQVVYYATQNEVNGVAGYQYYTFVGTYYSINSSLRNATSQLYKTVLR